MVQLFLAILSVVSSTIYEEDGVLVFNDSNFEEGLQVYPQILIEFYAPWCKFCQQFAPMYSKAAIRLQNENPSIKIGKIDATSSRETALKYHIEGYPTLKFFVNGAPTEYTGTKNENGVFNWVLKKMGPAYKVFNTFDSLNEFLNKNEVAVVLFSSNSNFSQVFEKVAKNSEGNYFALCTNSEIFAEFLVNDPGLVVFKHDDLKRTEFFGEFLESEIHKFIEKSLTPWIIPFNDKVISLVFSKQNPCLFVFRKDSDDEKYSNMLKNVANQLKGSLLLSFADLSHANSKRLVEFLGFPSSWMPFALIVNHNMQKFVYQKEITQKSLLDFVDRWKNGIEKPYLKSQIIPSQPYENNVRVVVGKNFADVVFDRKADVMIQFYAPWCGHCKKLAPQYSLLAKKFQNISSVIIAKIDATENEVEGFNVQEFPTLKFFPANNKEGIDYNGKKDADSIEEFIRTYAALPMKKTDL